MDQLRTSVLIVGIVVGVVNLAASMLIDGKQMSIDDAIIKAGSKVGMTKMFDLAQDHETTLVELDMLYKINQYREMRKEMTMEVEEDENQGSRKKRKAIKSVFYRWPNARVPYEISNTFTASERQLIMSAIGDYNRYTCIRFVPGTSSDRNRVRFQNGGGCSSYVGMIGSTQGISLAPGCRYKGIIIHEMGHAIGFQHEQTRPDRDEYISIATQNIQNGVAYNFMRYSRNQVNNYRVPYDYTSVMHYSQYAFSANGKPTIHARDSRYQKAMGNREGLSFNDIWLANEMYDCVKQNGCQPQKCPGGFQGPDCQCWCSSSDRSNPVKVCSGTGVVTKNPMASTTIAPKTCEDKRRNCPRWASVGLCQSRYVNYMMENCKYSCDHCTTCRDANSYCQYWKDYCRHKRYRDYLKINCKRSCGHCQASDVAQTTTPKPAIEDNS